MGSIERFTREAFDRLSQMGWREGDVCITALMPAYPGQPQIRHHETVLKNLLRKAESDLRSIGRDARQAQEFLAPIQDVFATEWDGRGLGFAVLSNGRPEQTWAFQVPFALPEFVCAAPHFYLKPLLPALRRPREFYILSLDQSRIQLYAGCEDCGDLTTVPLPHTPQGLQAMPQHEDRDLLAAGSFTRETTGGGEITHSHGSGEHDPNARLLRYFQVVNKSLADVLNGESAPMILEGVDYEVALYRRVNTYAHTLPQSIAGSPELHTPSALRHRAGCLLEEERQADITRALARYRELNNTPGVTRSFSDVTRAAGEGRIDTLFVADDDERWGQVDKATRRMRHRIVPSPGDDGLLSVAAVYTLRNKGEVFVVPQSKVPHGSLMAAILRY